MSDNIEVENGKHVNPYCGPSVLGNLALRRLYIKAGIRIGYCTLAILTLLHQKVSQGCHILYHLLKTGR